MPRGRGHGHGSHGGGRGQVESKLDISGFAGESHFGVSGSDNKRRFREGGRSF